MGSMSLKMSSENDRSKIWLKSAVSTWLTKMGVSFVVVFQIAVGGVYSDLLAENTSVRVDRRNTNTAADDQTFSPTANISASVGKGGKNEKQDVLLVKRLLSKFGYSLAQNSH